MEALIEIETYIFASLQTIYDAWGWLGVAALMVFENATGISPSEIILALAGWMLISQHGGHPGLIFLGGLYAALASTLGAAIPYWVARLGGRALVDRVAAWVSIPTVHIDRAECQFERWGFGLVLFGRLMPGIRTLVNIPAGLARMPFGAFLAATFTGAYLWCTLLIGAGYFLAHEWALIKTYIGQFLPWILLTAATIAAGYFLLQKKLPREIS